MKALISVLTLFLIFSVGGCAFGKKKKKPTGITEYATLGDFGREKNLGSPDRRGSSGGRKSTKPKSQPRNTSSYPISGNLRNPNVSVPRVTGNTQLTISRASVSSPYVAMTFDDGPHPSNTPRLLDILAQRNIKATFYVVGTNAKRYPALMRRIAAAGHEIGNHTVNHVSLTKVSDQRVRQELSAAAATIRSVCGVTPTTYRPPYGAINTRLKNLIFNEYGYTTVLWSVDPRDWQRPGSSVVSRRIVEGARNGSIILAHDIHAPTIDAIPSAMDELLRRGFRFVTVSQLMAMQNQPGSGPRQASVTVPAATLAPAE